MPYDTWKRKIQQMRPKKRINRVTTMAFLIAGIFASRLVQLGRVVSKLTDFGQPGENVEITGMFKNRLKANGAHRMMLNRGERKEFAFSRQIERQWPCSWASTRSARCHKLLRNWGCRSTP